LTGGYQVPGVAPEHADPILPADYYRRHAARVRRLASEATTPAVKAHLQDVAGQYERLAERVEASARSLPD
jgi:hypothetical protein